MELPELGQGIQKWEKTSLPYSFLQDSVHVSQTQTDCTCLGHVPAVNAPEGMPGILNFLLETMVLAPLSLQLDGVLEPWSGHSFPRSKDKMLPFVSGVAGSM